LQFDNHACLLAAPDSPPLRKNKKTAKVFLATSEMGISTPCLAAGQLSNAWTARTHKRLYFRRDSEWRRPCNIPLGRCKAGWAAKAGSEARNVNPPPIEEGKMKMNRPLVLLAVVMMHAAAIAQSLTPAETAAGTSWTPHPIVFAGPSFVGNGYQTLALNGGAGLLLNSPHLVSDIEGRYMNARKTNDNMINNRKGHERYLQGRIFYRYRPGLYFGGGAQWSETSTTNYTKKGWRPTFGVGGDHFGDSLSMRWQALYLLPGTDRLNALQGPEFQLWLPSPASRKHFFYRQTLGIYEFHTTITDPNDPALTALQTHDRHTAAFLDFTFGWRF
jgi:hypothetical protein